MPLVEDRINAMAMLEAEDVGAARSLPLLGSIFVPWHAR